MAFTSVIRDRDCVKEGHLVRLLCSIGIPCPPTCLCNGLEDGKQEINLEWPKQPNASVMITVHDGHFNP